jgi:hypothetical protein
MRYRVAGQRSHTSPAMRREREPFAKGLSIGSRFAATERYVPDCAAVSRPDVLDVMSAQQAPWWTGGAVSPLPHHGLSLSVLPAEPCRFSVSGQTSSIVHLTFPALDTMTPR